MNPVYSQWNNENLLDISRQVHLICKSLIGTHKRHTILREHETSIPTHLTSSSLVFLKEYGGYKYDPVSKVLFQILSSHCTQYGDMGWFCTLLCTSLIINGIESNLPLPDITEGYRAAFAILAELLENRVWPLVLQSRWSDRTQLTAILQSVIHTKTSLGLCEDDYVSVANCLLEAFIESLGDCDDGYSLAPNILYFECKGESPRSIAHLPGTVLLNIPMPRAFPEEGMASVRVAVFESSLELPALSGITVEAQSLTVSAKTLEYSTLSNMCDVIVRSGVRLVCCQKRIHPFLQRALARVGVICIPRVSILHIGAVLALSGARQLGSFSPALLQRADQINGVLEAGSLGYINRVGVRTVGGRRVLVLEGNPDDAPQDGSISSEALSRRRATSTLLIPGWTDIHCAEMRRVCENVVRLLSGELQTGTTLSVLPGAGCWQAFLVKKLRARLAAADKDLWVNGAQLFCDSLEHCARVVGDGDGFQLPSDECGAASKATFVSPDGRVVEAVLGSEGEPDLVKADVLDIFGPCINALRVAVEAAACVLEIDGVVVSST